MTYYFTKIIHTTFDSAIALVREELQKEGFGIISEINITENFKEKLNVDFRPYIILGACNPEFAYKALNTDENIGVMLPCNVVLQEKDEKEIQISVMNPILAIEGTGNKDLGSFAVDLTEGILRVLTKLE